MGSKFTQCQIYYIKYENKSTLPQIGIFLKNLTLAWFWPIFFRKGTNSELPLYIQTVTPFSLYDNIPPPKIEDRTAKANGNNSNRNGFATKASEQTQANDHAQTQQSQNTNGNNSHRNGFEAKASEQTHAKGHVQTQQSLSQTFSGLGAASTSFSTGFSNPPDNGNNSHSNGFAATASEQAHSNDQAQIQQPQATSGLGASSNSSSIMDLDDILEDIIDDEFQNEAPNFEAEVTVKTANEVSEQKREDRTPNKSMTLLKS